MFLSQLKLKIKIITSEKQSIDNLQILSIRILQKVGKLSLHITFANLNKTGDISALTGVGAEGCTFKGLLKSWSSKDYHCPHLAPTFRGTSDTPNRYLSGT